jgi:MFS family permease
MRKASILTIFLIVFIDLVGFGILLPNQQYYGQTFGIHNLFFLTLLGPAYSLFQFLFAPVLGRWSDRVGRRPVLLISQVGTLVGFLLLFAAHFVVDLNQAAAVFLLYFSRVLDGISGGNISTASAAIADITTPENRAKGMGAIGAALGLGFVFGPFIGGVVGKHLGLHFVPLTAALFSLAALLMTYFNFPETHHPGEVTEDPRRFSVQGLRHAIARPVIWALIWMAFVNGFAFAGMEQTFSLLVQERAFPPAAVSAPAVPAATGPASAEASAATTRAAAEEPDPETRSARLASGAAGYLFGAIGLIILVVQGGLIGRLTKRFGEPPLVIAGPVLIAIGLLLVGTAGMVGGVWAALVGGSALLALGSSLFNPSVQSLISRHAGRREQGEILGASQGMASLARAVGPLLAGYLYWAVSSATPYYLCAGICLLVAGWAVAIRGKLRPPAAEMAPPGGFPTGEGPGGNPGPRE